MKRKIRYVSLMRQPEPDLVPEKKSSRRVQVTVFSIVLFAGMVLSLIIPLRPSVSASEKRELAKFPEFSFEALVSGDYFDGIDAWFSDTFPFREAITGINTKINEWYGFGDKVTAMNTDTGDEIPDVPTRPADNIVETQATESAPSETVSESTTESTSVSTSVSESTEPSTQKPTEPEKAPEPKKTQTLGGVLVAGKAAYEYYNFVQATADRYIRSVSHAGKMLYGKAKVYDVLVPTSIDITLDDTTRKSVSSNDQKKAIDYFYGSMSKKVKTVDIYETLRSHRKEYIYFRTDHHWTALGAYYAYADVIKAAGKTPVDIKKMEEVSYGEFLGSFYSDTKQNKKLKKNADELIAYQPYYSTSLKYIDSKGTSYNWPLVNNVSDYNTAYKYSCFAAGDQPYVKVVNNDIASKDSCVVVKESFGNAMIPFIAGNYKKVYVLDYRYWHGDFYDFIEKKGVSDVYFINNMSATRNSMLVDSLEKLCR